MPATARQLLRARALKLLRQPPELPTISDQDPSQRYASLSRLYTQGLLSEGASDDSATQQMGHLLAYLYGVTWLEPAPPSPVALPITLSQWQFIYSENGLLVRGQRYGHPERPDGGVITTSRLIGLNTQQIQTRNSLYTLGTPQEGQQEVLDTISDLLYQLHFIRS